MFQKYFFIANYLLIIGVGSFYFYKIKDRKPLILFYGFLIYSMITEMLGTYFWYHAKINTASVYNTWNLLAFMFYSYFFLNFVKSPKRRFFIKLFAINILVLFLVNALFIQDFFKDVFKYNNTFGKLLMSIIILMYFGEILRSERIVYYRKTMSFWIALGVFIYSVGAIPVYAIGEYIDYSHSWVFKYVFYILNLLMGGCFITGFVMSKKEFNTNKIQKSNG